MFADDMIFTCIRWQEKTASVLCEHIMNITTKPNQMAEMWKVRKTHVSSESHKAHLKSNHRKRSCSWTNFHDITLQRTFRAEVLAHGAPVAHVKHLKFPVGLFLSFTLITLIPASSKNETVYIGTFSAILERHWFWKVHEISEMKMWELNVMPSK